MLPAILSGVASNPSVDATHCAVHEQQVLGLLDTLAPCDGMRASCLDGIAILRSSTALARVPAPGPCIVFFYRRHKGDGLSDDDGAAAPHYVTLPATLPLDVPLAAAPDTPAFALQVRIDLELAAELVLALNGCRGVPPAAQQVVAPARVDCDTGDAVLRLLRALVHPNDALVLGPGIVRELVYRVLTGPQGWAIHAALRQQGHAGRIGKALRRIHACYDQPVDVSTLASEASMSVTAFHSHFKAITRTTPIQYLKITRLQKARLLMVQDGINAATAARLVGYESCSQFSREFKRMFGRTPAHEAAAMKSALDGPPHPQLGNLRRHAQVI